MSKIVARSIRNAEYQRLKDGDLAILFFRESCPYCKDFKPTWNRVARKLNEGDHRRNYLPGAEARPDSYDDRLEVVKLDVTKFPAVKNYIQFPTVPCIAMYKRGKPVVFLTTQDRSLPNILGIIENYYTHSTMPLQGDFVIGTEDGRWPDTTSTPNATSVPTNTIAPLNVVSTLATVNVKPSHGPTPPAGPVTAANVLLKEESEFLQGRLDDKSVKKDFNEEIKKRQALLVDVDRKINLQKQTLQESLVEAEKSLQSIKDQIQNAQQKLNATKEELARKQEELDQVMKKRKEIEENEALKNQECAARLLGLLGGTVAPPRTPLEGALRAPSTK